MQASFIKLTLTAVALSLISSNAEPVTSKDYEEKTKGKGVFLWFYVDNSEPCEEMRTQIGQLDQHYKNSKDVFIGEIDCTRDADGEAEELCTTFGVIFHPYMKYGNPWKPKEYQSERDFESLSAFIEANVTVPCGPLNIDVCDDDEKVLVEKYLNMNIDELDQAIESETQILKNAEKTFGQEMEKINRAYNDFVVERDQMISDIKKGDLGHLKSVAASRMYQMKLESKQKKEAEASKTEREEVTE